MGKIKASSRASSVGSLSSLDLDDFKGSFSFDDFFKKLASDVLPSLLQGQEGEEEEGGAAKAGVAGPTFTEAERLLPLLKDTRRDLVELSYQVDTRLEKLKKEVGLHDSNHRKTLAELETGVETLFESFSRLDTRISGVGQTAARIGDHLQSADAQREIASQTIELIKYLMEFNSLGDLMELSPLFSDDSRVAEAAAIAQKLRSIAEGDVTGGQVIGVSPLKGASNPNRGLEVAVTNLQEYCNELENRLLARFDAASQRKELSTMAECAKISSQFDKGANAMIRYVGSRPMFLDVEVMDADARKVLGEEGSQLSATNLERRLSMVYNEIIETVRKEAGVISAVFPHPDAVMSLLVQDLVGDGHVKPRMKQREGGKERTKASSKKKMIYRGRDIPDIPFSSALFIGTPILTPNLEPHSDLDLWSSFEGVDSDYERLFPSLAEMLRKLLRQLLRKLH